MNCSKFDFYQRLRDTDLTLEWPLDGEAVPCIPKGFQPLRQEGRHLTDTAVTEVTPDLLGSLAKLFDQGRVHLAHPDRRPFAIGDVISIHNVPVVWRPQGWTVARLESEQENIFAVLALRPGLGDRYDIIYEGFMRHNVPSEVTTTTELLLSLNPPPAYTAGPLRPGDVLVLDHSDERTIVRMDEGHAWQGEPVTMSLPVSSPHWIGGRS